MEPKQCFWGQAYVAQSGHACTQTLLCAESSSSLCQFTSARDRRPRLLEPRFPQRDPRGAVGAAGGCSVLRKEAGGPRGPGQGVRGPGCGGGSGGAAEPAGVSELSKLQKLAKVESEEERPGRKGGRPEQTGDGAVRSLQEPREPPWPREGPGDGKGGQRAQGPEQTGPRGRPWAAAPREEGL